jgi:hypothetical protein
MLPSYRNPGHARIARHGIFPFPGQTGCLKNPQADEFAVAGTKQTTTAENSTQNLDNPKLNHRLALVY